MDGRASGVAGTPVERKKKGQKQGRRSSSTAEAEEEDSDSESESSSSSSSAKPTSALDNFRQQWEAELKKVTTSNVNSALNLVSASQASLKYPNPTSMAGAVSSSKENHPGYHPFTGKLGEKSGANASANVASPGGEEPTLAVPDTGTEEEQARRWFLQGVGFEKHGDLYDAVRCYRRAVQLVPDIEYRISQGLPASGMKKTSSEDSDDDDDSNNSESEHEQVSADKEEPSDDDEEEEGGPLVKRFLKTIEKRGWEFFIKSSNSDKKHLGDLPIEVISYIMRWVVSSELDIRSLEILASACKGFYCIAQDDKLWQMVCERLWSSCVLDSGFTSYREMFVNRPRVRFDGCYISRLTYIRAGENSFQDAAYRPWHFVEYYRYIRFFPDGTVHYLTSSEEPGVAIPGLKDKVPRNMETLKGKYQMYGNNIVTAMVKKTNPIINNSGFKNKRIENQQTTSFHIEFEIHPVKGRQKNCLLKWAHHAAFITKTVLTKGRNNLRQNQNQNSSVTSTAFDLSSTKYPPLYFSRVKSYTTKSESILE